MLKTHFSILCLYFSTLASHSIIGAIHSSAVLQIVLKKRKLPLLQKKREKGNGGKKKGVAEASNDEETQDDDTGAVDVKPDPKGTTTEYFIKFINELLDIMDEDESLKGSYLLMDNAGIHKSKQMVRKVEFKGYRVMYLPLYSPIKQK